jgi:histone-lysine N-methyltransferase SETMAR
MIEHLPYSPDLAPANFFLFPKVKKELAGLTLMRETFKKEWEGGCETLTAVDFVEAFQQWFLRCEKCITIGGSYVDKT